MHGNNLSLLWDGLTAYTVTIRNFCEADRKKRPVNVQQRLAATPVSLRCSLLAASLACIINHKEVNHSLMFWWILGLLCVCVFFLMETQVVPRCVFFPPFRLNKFVLPGLTELVLTVKFK